MKKNNFILSENTTLLKALKIISDNKNGLAAVVNNKKKLLGVLNDFDIRQGLIEGISINDKISKIYNKNPISLTLPISDKQIVQILQSEAYKKLQPSCYPVVNKKGEFMKIVRAEDLRSPFLNKISKKKTTNKKKILLIGGAGYIGSVLAKNLAEHKFEVTIFDKFIYGKNHLNKKKYKLVEGDTNNIEQLFQSIKDTDIVIHLAELVGDPLCALRPENTYKTNFLSTLAISNICKNLKIEKFIYFSSCSVYGASLNEKILKETSSLNPVSIYAKIKLMCEKAIMQNADTFFNPTIIRLGTVFGYSPRMRLDLVVNILVYNALNFKKIKINGGDQWRPFVHLEDISEAVVKIILSRKLNTQKRIYNIVGQNFKLIEVAQIIKKILPATHIVISKKTVDKRNYRVSGLKAKKKLKFTSKINLEDGIKNLIEDFKKKRIKNHKSKQYYNILNSEKF